ncbi:MAG TPA: GAF domain-containing protein, partial [Thermoanaerobaculia bacterium]|nr:GAF domain-containing protein [Thermoanaerobaculia bacterium]
MTARPPGARPAFFWVIAALGAAAAAAHLLGAVWLFRYGPVKKVTGWRAAYERDAWIVSRVDPKGPAAGLLEEGDRLLAIDGDARAAAVGPFFRILQLAPGRDYELRVARRSEPRAARLTLAALPRGRGELGYLVSLLLLAAAFLATSLVIGMLKPDDPIARWGAMALFFPSFTLLEAAISPLFASMSRLDAALFLAIPVPNPFHLAVAFAFYSRFPAGVPRGRLAALCGRVFFALGLALWIAEELIRRLLAQAPLPASGLFTASLPGLLAFERLDRPYSLVAFAAICGIIAYRLRRVVEPDQRRRMRWIAYGSLAGLVPWLLYSALSLAFAGAVGSGWLAVANRVANLALVIVPIVTGFAIVKHRLFDINVVVRRTLQYLLARNVLTAVTALAIVAFGATVYENRNRTLAEIFLHGTDAFALCVAGAALLLARKPLREWLDRRFFREAYDRERILVDLARDVGRLDSSSEISRHVSREIDAALHPKSIRVFQRDLDRSSHVLVWSSSEGTPSLRIADDAAVLSLMEGEERPRDVPFDEGELPDVESRWLEELGVTLIVPMRASDQRLVGLLLLGERRSEEPYGPNDRKLLSAIAGQMALFYENSLLKGRVERDERYKRDVLSRFEDGGRFVKECPKCGACFGGATSSRCPTDGSELMASLPVDQTLLGRYRLDKLIGRGGMGAVYEAHDLRLGRLVAVKILVGPRFVNRASVRRFEREARASAKLNHPNIIS